MASVNLGKIKLKWRGTYAGGTAYTPDDVVEYTDGTVTSTYICVTESTGNCLLYTSPSPRDRQKSRMPSSA